MGHARIHPELWKQQMPMPAMGLWLCSISWSVKYRTDVIPQVVIDRLFQPNDDTAAEQLEAYGFWHWTDEGWKLNPDWYRCDYRSDAQIERAKMTASMRRRVLERDGHWCVGCGWPHTPDGSPDGSGLHIDHMVPVSRGGRTEMGNLTVLCAPCNLSKGALTFDEWWVPNMLGDEPERGVEWELD